MLRKRENPDSWKAGILAIGVHAVLLVAMLISFNWKAAHTVLNVTEVELWDKLPKSNPLEIRVEPKPIVEEKSESKPEPKPIVEEKPKPVEPKVDIELEKKKKELEQKEQEQKQKLKELDELRKKEALDKIKKEAREDELREKKTAENKKHDDALAKLKEDMRNENGADVAKASSAANSKEIGKYIEKIKDQIRSKVNKTVCGDDNLELRFEINLLPTGELNGNPKITKISGSDACDAAVERAIIESSPLSLPDDPALKAQFRNLKLKFRPND